MAVLAFRLWGASRCLSDFLIVLSRLNRGALNAHPGTLTVFARVLRSVLMPTRAMGLRRVGVWFKDPDRHVSLVVLPVSITAALFALTHFKPGFGLPHVVAAILVFVAVFAVRSQRVMLSHVSRSACLKFKVVWRYAVSTLAFVVNLMPFGNFTHKCKPRLPVGCVNLSVSGTKHSVSIFMDRCFPFPAAGFSVQFKLFYEAIKDWFVGGHNKETKDAHPSHESDFRSETRQSQLGWANRVFTFLAAKSKAVRTSCFLFPETAT